MWHRVGCFIAAAVAVLLCVAAPSVFGQTQAMPLSVLEPPGGSSPALAGEYGLVDPSMGVSPQTPVNSGAAGSWLGPGTICYGSDPPPVGLPAGGRTCWTWQLLPPSLLYKSYLAGPREPRLGTQWIYTRDYGWYWDSTLGGRAGLLRYGSTDTVLPEGWQLDVEGAAFPRLDAEHARDLVAADFRVGVPLTFRRGPWAMKFGYYHISAHLGDEYMLTHPTVERINYVRDSLVLGLALHPHPDWRLYSEVGYAFMIDGGAKPWEFQFGVEFSPADPSTIVGAPFAACNGHLRQENDFGGNVTVQMGWQWRGHYGRTLRVGAHYLNGLSPQYQFYRDFEDQVGVGIWYDF